MTPEHRAGSVRRAASVHSVLLVLVGLLAACGPGSSTDDSSSGNALSTEDGSPPAFGSAPGRGTSGNEGSGEIGDPPVDSVLRIVDDAGREVLLPEPPRRIVSLVPSATETLLALGAGERLVARTDYDSLPGVRSLPSVGGGLHPNMERLVSLEPDLVIRFSGPSDQRTPARLTDLGIPHLAVRPDGIEDVRRIIEIMGGVAAAPAKADSLLARMDSTLARVAETVRPFSPKRVAFVLGGSPPWVAGPGTFVDELIRLAGGRNAFSDLSDLYGPVSREAFVSRAIDVVLTSQRGDLDFVPSDIPVRRVPPEVETPGLDLGDSARLLARILHPEAFR